MLFEFRNFGSRQFHQSLVVPDYPYTKKMCKDGNECRIAISPCEWNTAKEQIDYFWGKVPNGVKNTGCDVLYIIDETDNSRLAVWEHPVLTVFSANYGLVLEIESLERYVQDVQG